MRFLSLAFVAIVLLYVQTATGDQPRQPVVADPVPQSDLPLGKWNVEFANGVKETCVIRRDGSAMVVEPARSSPGKATVKGGAVVIVFDDDRTERWTAVGQRLVVEHWFPASQLPTVTPVLGIAETAR